MMQTDNPPSELLATFRRKLDVPAVIAGTFGPQGLNCLELEGTQKRGDPTPATAGDLVHIGSCLKMITATLYGGFVERGQVQWDTPVPALFPDLADSIHSEWQPRTVRELLHCTAGMAANPPNTLLRTAYTDPRPLTEQRTEQRTEQVKIALSKPPRKPGKFVYSNLGYMVVGAAIDRLQGTSYEQALDTHLLQPLGITSVGYGPPPELWGHRARFRIGPLMLGKGQPADPADPKSDNPPAFAPAGTLHLSITDWVSLLRLFLQGVAQSVVSESVIATILQPPETSARRGPNMTMGWMPVLNDGLSFGAQGSNTLWSATVLLDEQRHRGSFVVCNDGRTSVLSRSVPLAHQLLDITRG